MPRQKKEKTTEPVHLRADITPELDEQIDLAVALMKLRGNKELSDRSKLIRRAVEQYLEGLRADIDRLRAEAQNPTTAPAAPASRKPR